MALKFTRKGIIAIIALFLLIGGGTAGYIVWRINQEAQLSEEDADAGGGGGGLCRNKCDCSDGPTKNCGDEDKDENGKTIPGEKKCYRHNCQDFGGGWILTTDKSVADACGNCGYSDKPVPKPGDKGDCSCQSYTNSNGKKCGVNCTFPSGTQAKVDNLTENNGKSYIAMCKPGGIITYEVFTSSHVCWGLQNECKNPVGKPPDKPEEPEEPTNVCEGGKLIESGKTTFNEGETVTVTGYAYDKDGVDKSAIAVTLNGAAVGNATVVDACPSNNATVCSSVGTSKKPVIWSYSFTPEEGDNTVAVSWKDTKGLGGSNCQASTTVTSVPTEEETNPDWTVEKSAAGICLNDNTEDSSFRVDYTITVTNVGDGEGEIDKLVDTLDTKVLSSYILTETIDPSATVSSNTITWDLSGTEGVFAADQAKTYKYSIEIPNTAFGSYTNTVVVTPVEGDTFSDTAIVAGDCEVPEVPETAIFDSWLARVGFGFLLISAGLAYMSYMDGFNDNFARFLHGLGYEGRVEKSRKRFEKKVVK